MTEAHPITGVPTTLRSSAIALVLIIGWCAAIGSVVGLLGDRPWFLDLFSHFRLQYAAMLLLSSVVAIRTKRWRTSAGFSVVFSVNAVLLAPLWFAPNQPEVSSKIPTAKVLAFNVLTMNQRKSEVAEWLSGERADVVVMQEVNTAWITSLDANLEGYTRQLSPTIREDNFGLAVYVRKGVEVLEFTHAVDPAGVPRIEVVVGLRGEGRLRVIAVHTLPPIGAEYSALRSKQLAEASQRASLSAEPVVIAGDLNATRWSAPLRRLRRDTGLRDSAEGFGFQGTWPSGLRWTGMIPIDHVLVSPDIRVDDRRIGPDLGSDHRAVVVDLRLP
ncbi:MAG: endonuclease/exonuclease/phosphatase family protein [Planctomycetota bacterium]